LKATWANSSQDTISKKPFTKKKKKGGVGREAGGVEQGIGPEHHKINE
jgi:hypothetical protein